jgi:glycosyltransferase involved in cell wall biosynthesis
MDSAKKVLYFHIGLSSFVEKDIAILSEHFDLRVKFIDLSKKHYVLKGLLIQFFYLLRHGWTAHVFVSQFGGYHSLLPGIFARCFRKKSVIVLGGTDTVSFPSIRYGAFYLPVMRFFTKWSYKCAHLLLPVSENLIHCVYDYQEKDGKFQGVKHFCPKLKTPFRVIYNGYDSSHWYISDEKELKSFVTIGANLNSRFGFKLKGIDLLIEIAPKFPECTFYIIGGAQLNDLPSNVKGLSNLPHEQLPSFLARKEYYLQLSLSEGFPNALCEAMLSGCIPIVSNVGAMPEIVNDERLILNKKNADLLSTLIEGAIENRGYHKPSYWRERITSNYPLERRSRELTEAINSL